MAQIRGTFTIFGDVGHGRPTAAGSPVAGTAAKNLHSPRSLGAAGKAVAGRAPSAPRNGAPNGPHRLTITVRLSPSHVQRNRQRSAVFADVQSVVPPLRTAKEERFQSAREDMP